MGLDDCYCHAGLSPAHPFVFAVPANGWSFAGAKRLATPSYPAANHQRRPTYGVDFLRRTHLYLQATSPFVLHFANSTCSIARGEDEALTNAQQLIERTKAVLAKTDDAIRGHRFVVAIEEGRIDREALHYFCGSQYQMWKTNSTVVSMARFENHPYREVFLTPPEVEAGAAREIAALAQRLGMDSAALEQFEPAAEAFGYATYKAWLICYGSAAEMACARALNLSAWGYNCGKIGRGLQNHYGLTADETQFFDEFSGLRELENKAASVIDADLQKGVDPTVITRAARLMQAYETMFWDAMARHAGL